MWKKLFPVCLWMEFSCKPPVNVELDSGDVSSFRAGMFGEFDATLCEKPGTILGGDFPLLTETRLVVTAPGIELRIGWKLRMSAKQIHQRSVTSAQQAEEIVGNFLT